MDDITKMDLYELLNIEETCSTNQVTTAFRRKALLCHPDKFPDDAEKKELFLLVRRALEILTDKEARQAYDACRKQKKFQQERLSQMDEKRKKFREDLERKEQGAGKTTNPTVNRVNTVKLNAEIERLRREGNRLVDEELEKLNNILEQDKQKSSSNHVIIIIRYIPNTPRYTDEELRQIFNKYGEISAIVNSNPKSALVEFCTDHISSFIEHEKGLEGRPFASVKLRKSAAAAATTTTTTTSVSSATKKQSDTVDLTKPDFEDFEAMIMKKLAQHASSS